MPSLLFFCGVIWVRYLFAVGFARGIIRALFLLLGGTIDIASITPIYARYLYIAYLIFMLCYSIAITIILFKSKAISEFLYARKKRINQMSNKNSPEICECLTEIINDVQERFFQINLDCIKDKVSVYETNRVDNMSCL